MRVVSQRRYFDCAQEGFFYVAHGACYVLERGSEARAMACVPEVFGAQDADWAFVSWDGDVGAGAEGP